MKEPRRLPVVRIQDIRPELRRLERRALLRNALSLGGVALLTGCDLSTNSGVDAALKSILRFDDKVQAGLFSGMMIATSGDVGGQPRVACAACEFLPDIFGKDKSPSGGCEARYYRPIDRSQRFGLNATVHRCDVIPGRPCMSTAALTTGDSDGELAIGRC
jgi:hypothetical protein